MIAASDSCHAAECYAVYGLALLAAGDAAEAEAALNRAWKLGGLTESDATMVQTALAKCGGACIRTRQRSGEGVVRGNGRPKECFWRVRLFCAPLSFAVKTPKIREGANREKLTMKKLISITRCFFTVCVPYKP